MTVAAVVLASRMVDATIPNLFDTKCDDVNENSATNVCKQIVDLPETRFGNNSVMTYPRFGSSTLNDLKLTYSRGMT